MQSREQLPGLFYFRDRAKADRAVTIETDLCVYGSTSVGVAAAIAGTRLGKRVALAGFDDHLGGLSSGGLGATDIGNKAAIGGLSRQFYQRLGKHYGQDEAWKFEPKIAEKILREMLAETNVVLRPFQHLAGVQKEGNRIIAIEMTDGTTYRAKQFIDASYEGDLMALAGVAYHVGREANSVFRETLNGIHFGHPGHNFKAWVDPYKIEGRPESGLLPLVQDVSPGVQGDGDACVQAYNFRMCLTDAPANRKPFPKPADYDPARYELLRRYIHAGVFDSMRLTTRMPNDKTDTNNYGSIASDHIGANYDWPDGSFAAREVIFQDHVSYTAGLFYFLQNDPALPDDVKHEMGNWGLPQDEFDATGGFPHQLYVREARRMMSDHVCTEHDCRGFHVADDPVGLAAYNMDSHNCRRLVVGGRVINDGNVEVAPASPYGISYRSIIPNPDQCENLLVPWCLSASHIAFGSIRMEPVGMVLGESAAHAASLAIDLRCPLNKVPYNQLSASLKQAGQVLTWTTK